MGGLSLLTCCASSRDSRPSAPVSPMQSSGFSTDIGPEIPGIGNLVITSPLEKTKTANKTSRLRLCQILSVTPVPSVLLDHELDIVEVSNSYLSLAITTREECVGYNIYQCLLDKNPNTDCASIQNAIKTVIKSRGVYTVDDIYLTSTKCWRMRLVPIFEGEELLVIILEVDEYIPKCANHTVSNDEPYVDETYRILVNNVNDYAIFMIDREGYITTWNAGASILKQYKSEEILGKHFSIFYSDEDNATKKPQRELEICLREGRVEDEGWRYKKDGSRFWASVIIAPVYRGTQHIGFSKVTRDLTERKASETRLIAAFEEASKLKSDFLANMSHEIRTPMHGMLAAGMLLMDTDLNEEQRELAKIIEESGSVLVQVINDILDYSKLASGSFTMKATTISVQDIISAVVRASQATLPPGLVINVESEGAIPTKVQSDPLRYRQVLQNMVSNAIKFTEEGSISIITKVSAEDETSYILLTEVSDTGIGVPSSQAVDALFTPFAQFDSSVTKRFKGAGLGLSICKSLVEHMGGSIGYRPNQKGSTFWFTIKLDKVTECSEAPVAVQQPGKITDLALAKQILIVEDNLINQTIVMKLLKGYGFKNIDVTSNGKEGLGLVKTKPLSYGVILMDINMPVMDGITATEMIRKMGLDVPIIAMTANALKGDKESYLARGFNDYVAKPVDRKMLLRTLSKWL